MVFGHKLKREEQMYPFNYSGGTLRPFQTVGATSEPNCNHPISFEKISERPGAGQSPLESAGSSVSLHLFPKAKNQQRDRRECSKFHFQRH